MSYSPNKIIDGLYLGSYPKLSDKKSLQSHKITHILNVAHDVEPVFLKDKDFVYKHVKMVDESTTKLIPFFKECHSFIDQCISKKGVALVHCQAGISRSCSCVISYLMLKGQSFRSAVMFVKSKRRQCAPNHGFLQQLVQFETMLNEKCLLGLYVAEVENFKVILFPNIKRDEIELELKKNKLDLKKTISVLGRKHKI